MPIQKKPTAAAATAKPAAKPAAAAVKPAAAAAPEVTMEREAFATVTTTVLEGGTIRGEPVVSEEREIKKFITNPAFSSVKVGYNRPGGGHMELIKIDVSVGMPHYVEESDSAALQLLDKAQALLELAAAQFMPAGDGETVGADDGIGEPAAEGEGEAPAEEGAAEEAGEINKAYLQTADLETLQTVATDNPDLGVDPADYAEEADLREVLISVIDPDGADAEGMEAAAEETEGAYTQETLEAATTEDLKAVYEAWEMGKFPPGPDKIARKTAIKKILEVQTAAAG